MALHAMARSARWACWVCSTAARPFCSTCSPARRPTRTLPCVCTIAASCMQRLVRTGLALPSSKRVATRGISLRRAALDGCAPRLDTLHPLHGGTATHLGIVRAAVTGARRCCWWTPRATSRPSSRPMHSPRQCIVGRLLPRAARLALTAPCLLPSRAPRSRTRCYAMLCDDMLCYVMLCYAMR